MSVDLEEELVRELERRISRRRKEIISLATGVTGIEDGGLQAALRRGGIALFYAHWEAAVKESVTLFLEFLDKKGMKLSLLQENFILLLNTDGSEKSFDDVLNRIKASGRLLEGPINAKSLRRIFWQLCWDYGSFEQMELVIDNLHRSRNRIVHGEDRQVGLEEFSEMAVKVQVLIDEVIEQVTISVLKERYLRE